MPAKKRTAPQEFKINDHLPTLHIDDIYLVHRTDKMNFIRLIVTLPDINSEQARIMISDEDLHRIIDNLCLWTSYYPKIPSKSKKKVTKKS